MNVLRTKLGCIGANRWMNVLRTKLGCIGANRWMYWELNWGLLNYGGTWLFVVGFWVGSYFGVWENDWVLEKSEKMEEYL